jgi:putative AdoMet-dependent methyltransferase
MRWQYDEFNQVGIDYAQAAEVEVYEARHGTFRDIEAEFRGVLETLKLDAKSVVIDFGAGTGAFALQAARRCAKVHAVDVSKAMLEHARTKAEKAGLSNIDFHHAGFLTYAHDGEMADALVTTYAFHHLPDFWKGVALKRMRGMLKSGGQMFMRDVILAESNALENIQAFIDGQLSKGGEGMRDDAETHFKDEFSTYDWVLEGLLERAGFQVINKSLPDGVIGAYLCRAV